MRNYSVLIFNTVNVDILQLTETKDPWISQQFLECKRVLKTKMFENCWAGALTDGRGTSS